MTASKTLSRGEAYRARLNDGRQVFIDGKPVENVATSPAFKNAVSAIVRMYDAIDKDPENLGITLGDGRVVSRAWDLPRSYEDLVKKREALVRLSEMNYGFFGRSPDHLSCALGGMVMGQKLLSEHDAERTQALVNYFNYVRENELYLTYVIVNPSADRSKPASEHPDGLLATVVAEDDDGITIRGGKMLGTGTAISDELLVGNIAPQGPHEADQCFTCAMSVSTPGVKILSRRSYEGDAKSSFDYPLSANFDENDALVYFDNVKVPWDRVFCSRDTKMSFKLFHEAGGALMTGYHGIVRLLTKLNFLLGLTRRMCETAGLMGMPQIQQELGILSSKALMAEAMVMAMETKGKVVDGYFLPDRAMVSAARSICQEMYPDIITLIRKLGGGGLIMLPSSELDFDNPEMADIIDRTQYSAIGDSMDRVRLNKLAWDAIGSEFGSRHTQYEMFYSGSLHVSQANTFRAFDWSKGAALVDEVTALYQTRS